MYGIGTDKGVSDLVHTSAMGLRLWAMAALVLKPWEQDVGSDYALRGSEK